MRHSLTFASACLALCATGCAAFSLAPPSLSRLGGGAGRLGGRCRAALRLRGGTVDRPWRDIPLEQGETAFFYSPRARDSPIVMTATDWTQASSDSALEAEEYPDQRVFGARLADTDPEIFGALGKELRRQQDGIELIASENIVSRAVLEAQGSVLTNKYAEGYPSKRYYGGCEHVDTCERLALERAKELFECTFANVQPHSGAQANQAVMLALAAPGDTVLGMSLAAGGHLTHGAAPNLSGKWFNAVQYGVQEGSGLIDYDEVESLAKEHKPKIIIAGGSAYSRVIDFKRFREIADSVGAYFMVDMAHFAGLVAGKAYPSPLPHAHIVTTTTHKTLRGPRGGMILSNDEELGKKVNSAVFPGLQGGPLMHVIAAKAVAFGEALRPSFRVYSQTVIDNARALSGELKRGGLDIVSGGTDSHVVLVDLRPKGLTGKVAEASLERAGLTCNKNSVPFDPEKPFVTSGIRLGTPAATTRGLMPQDFVQVGELILRVIDGLVINGPEGNGQVEAEVRERVRLLCDRFPIYADGTH